MGAETRFRKMKERAFDRGDTKCCWCNLEMYFCRQETREQAKARLGVSSRKELRLRAATIEHLIPKSRGGTDDKWNIALACNLCNSQRPSDLPADAFLSIIRPAPTAPHGKDER